MIACEFCDLLHAHPVLSAGEKAYCSRCAGVLAKASRSPIEGTLALALTAAILLVLANVFPFLQISLEGQVRENTIATGGKFFHHEGKSEEQAVQDDPTPEPTPDEHKHHFLRGLFHKGD